MSTEFDHYWQRTLRNNDLKAFEWIYKNSFKVLCFYSYQLTGDEFLAEEIVQEVLVKVWNERLKIEVKGNFKAYLFQCVHNHSVNKLIQKNTQKFSVNKLATNELWQFIADTYSYNDFLVEKLEAMDTEKKIAQAVDELPDQCREIFKLSKYDNKTNDEIAAIYSISVNTVRTHIYRALEKIKEALEKNS